MNGEKYYMKLITFQSFAALEYLKNHGYLICDDRYINQSKMSFFYRWIIKGMNQRIKNQTSARFPLWCWVKCGNSICPPRHKGKPVEGFDVKITFHAEPKDLFITDFRRYSFLLSNLYIPRDKKDQQWFNQLLEERHITKDELKAYVRPDKYPNHRTDQEFLDVCRIIEQSFERCITQDSDILQGCLWKIDQSQIEQIEILEDNGYIYGSLNYKHADGKRRDWIQEFYQSLQ